MPAVVNITVENDADFYMGFAYQSTNGSPIDLTGATSFLMKVRREAEDVDAVLQLSDVTGEIAVTNAPNGQFTILILQAVLVELALGNYVHSLVVDLNGIKMAMWSGALTINAGPSR